MPNNSFDKITLVDSSTDVNGTGSKVVGPFTFDYLDTKDVHFAVYSDAGQSELSWQHIDVDSVDPVTKLVTLVTSPLDTFPEGGSIISSIAPVPDIPDLAGYELDLNVYGYVGVFTVTDEVTEGVTSSGNGIGATLRITITDETDYTVDVEVLSGGTGYAAGDEIYVEFDTLGNETSYPDHITLTVATLVAEPLLTSPTRIYRSTTTTPLVDFQAGSRISETDLDTAYRQALFTAQEVGENANGVDNRPITNRNDIADSAINDDKLDAGAVTNAKLNGGAVTADKLSATLDLSGKTVTLPNSAITSSAVTAHAADIKTAVDLSSGMVGVLPVANGGTGIANASKKGLVLETFDLPCEDVEYDLGLGRSVIPSDVSERQQLTTDYVEVTGSSISYTPPTGTKLVVYEFRCYVGIDNVQDSSWAGFKLQLDGVEVDDYFQVSPPRDGNLASDGGFVTIKHVFRIEGEANAATGRVASWTSDKAIRVLSKERSSNYHTCLHGTTYYGGLSTTSTVTDFVRPSISITAIS